MKESVRQNLTTAGIGTAAGAAGFAAAKGLGNDGATSTAVGAGVGLTAALLAAVINRKVKQRPPLMSPTNAAIASATGGGAIGIASLTGMNALSENDSYKKGVSKASDFILDLATKPNAPIQNAFGKSLLELGSLSGTPAAWDNNSSWIKNVFNAARRHKRIGASALIGLASTPFIYNALRGNGSD
jgi:hypothetical protein